MARNTKSTPAATTPAPAAQVVVTTASTPARRGESTVSTPVAQVWVNSHNMCVAAREAGKPAPARKVLVAAAMDMGVTYYTARTQVQAYLKATNGGTQHPDKLPRHVVLAD